MYTLVISRNALTQLREIPKSDRGRITEKIDELVVNPRPFGCQKLQGYENEYRIRSGNYRIVYRIENDKLFVEVIKVAHRKDVYRK